MKDKKKCVGPFTNQTSDFSHIPKQQVEDDYDNKTTKNGKLNKGLRVKFSVKFTGQVPCQIYVLFLESKIGQYS
jgi:hypothetical protein